MTVLTDKEQPSARAIVLAGVATDGTHLTRVVGIDFDGHASRTRCFVAKHALQFGKGPLGSMTVGFPLLLTGLFASFPLCPFTNTGQVFQTDYGMRMRIDNLFRNRMVGIQLQPSLSSADRHKAAFGGTSAFSLKSLVQAGVVVGFGTDCLARIEGWLVLCSGGHGKIPLPDIHTYHRGVAL